MMRLIAALAIVAVVACSGLAWAEGPDDPAKPGMADLMTVTQLRHFKLWYAERMENWQLADYELRQMRAVLARMAKLYSDAASSAGAIRFGEDTGPIFDDLQRAIGEHYGKGFETSFGRLTEACNRCHEATGVSFIAVQVPKRSPFSNQNFRAAKP